MIVRFIPFDKQISAFEETVASRSVTPFNTEETKLHKRQFRKQVLDPLHAPKHAYLYNHDF